MLRLRSLSLAVSLTLIACVSVSLAAGHKHKTFTDPSKAGESFKFQGEYAGTLSLPDGDEKYGAQVIALGDDKYRLVGYHGGLPGAGWDKSEKIVAEGTAADGAVTFALDDQPAKVVLKGGLLTISEEFGDEIGTMKKVTRKSPTMGAKPPKDAVVLFDGTTAENFKNGRIVENKLLAEGVTSKQQFGDHHLHLEFRTPYMPTARGQARGNSGCYVQGRYEVQILDSFGLEGKDNECGGIYKIAVPAVNMCLPPLSWQTYDIDFTAPKFENGKKVKNARITIVHNGVTIHNDIELPSHTAGGISAEKSGPGPVYLQNHGNPVRFRNIWVKPKK
ncbi:MAG: DUF1080 domain-containing protein [Pirellulales bacterium]|nr:DUF1080 domain-containing protein [Pirellulales bacterium]